jgi:SAM-dependent methyltransferase
VTDHSEFDVNYAAEQLRRSAHPLRRFIKRFYLDNVLRDVRGPTIDFGCGAGQILERLPPGSTGIEINPVLVAKLKERGFDVRAYDAIADDFAFTGFETERYKSLVISHVLEHFADTAQVMRKMWRACARLGIETIIAVVPGKKGYASDATHKTFVTADYLHANGLEQCEGYALDRIDYFPINAARVGEVFVFHEMKLVYRRVGKSP